MLEDNLLRSETKEEEEEKINQTKYCRDVNATILWQIKSSLTECCTVKRVSYFYPALGPEEGVRCSRDWG